MLGFLWCGSNTLPQLNHVTMADSSFMSKRQKKTIGISSVSVEWALLLSDCSCKIYLSLELQVTITPHRCGCFCFKTHKLCSVTSTEESTDTLTHQLLHPHSFLFSLILKTTLSLNHLNVNTLSDDAILDIATLYTTEIPIKCLVFKSYLSIISKLYLNKNDSYFI